MMAIIEATLAYKRSGPCCRDDGVGEEAGDQSHEQPIGQKVLERVLAATSSRLTRRQFRVGQPGRVTISSRVPLRRLLAVQDPDWSGHFAKPATRLMHAAMMTTPSGKDTQACRKAMRRICLDSMLVSETWNVMPIVKDR